MPNPPGDPITQKRLLTAIRRIYGGGPGEKNMCKIFEEWASNSTLSGDDPADARVLVKFMEHFYRIEKKKERGV